MCRISNLESYRDHITKMSLNEPRACLARYYPNVTYKWSGDSWAPPVGKCFSCHSNDCTAECMWHPDNPDKETRIEWALKAGAEKNISTLNLNMDLNDYWKEQQHKWGEWKEKTFRP